MKKKTYEITMSIPFFFEVEATSKAEAKMLADDEMSSVIDGWYDNVEAHINVRLDEIKLKN